MSNERETQNDINRRDLNDEIGGHETGRIYRFLTKEAREALGGNSSQKSRERMNFLDMLLLTDPVYAALYADVTDKIEEIDRAVNSALSSLNQRIVDQEQRLALLKDRAYKLQDGTRVYQSEDGSVYAENGAVLSDRQALLILTIKKLTIFWKFYPFFDRLFL
ncbi:MAG: hypothetical protein H6858_03310 [Rhodospirillales bacterium]|nr:hypothetical protein [Alphaproteobacteria bacterium]MCB9976611.1 hypothetical protein [Rhodospirillales bacterium]